MSHFEGPPRMVEGETKTIEIKLIIMIRYFMSITGNSSKGDLLRLVIREFCRGIRL